MNDDAKKIKELRESTGAGFLDCKVALEKNSGDVEKAAAWLRKEGLIKAVKKLSRTAQSGAIVVAKAEDESAFAMVEFNTETDFVARNEKFQTFAAEVASLALSCHSLADLEKMKLKSGLIVQDAVLGQMSTIGENIKISRLKTVLANKGKTVGFYVHNQIGPSMGNIAALVVLESNKEGQEVKSLARGISAHVAAMSPLYIASEDVPAEAVAQETEQALQDKALAGKPESIAQKIVQNKVNQFKESISLFSQEYVLDQSVRVEDFISSKAKEIGAQIKVLEFTRFSVGEKE